MAVWEARPPNWLLGPRVMRKSGESSVYPVGGECKKWLWTEKKKKIVGIKTQTKKNEREIELKCFLGGESCLLAWCLKIVNPLSMDMCYFLCGFASTAICSLRGGRGGRGRGCEADRNRNSGRKYAQFGWKDDF